MSQMIEFYQTELRRRPLMPALLAQADIDVPHSRLIRVPAHVYPDSHPSAYVYPDHITDYGDANKCYDLLAVAREWLGLGLDQAVGLLAELAGLTPPVPFRGEVRRVSFAPLAAPTRTDPNEFAVFAARCTDALSDPRTLAAEAAARYLDTRGLLGAARHYRLGVADSTVASRFPGRIWQDMVTMPTWHQGELLALKGRNLLGKGEGREMRNLSGTGTAPYGLREMGDAYSVLVVEGETDTLSVWAAFGGQVAVVGIPGATHWKKLQHAALSDRHLFLCLDTDEAGQKAVREAQTWAADEGRALTVVPGIGDKNALLVSRGPAHLRELLRQASETALKRGRRVLL